MKATHITEKVIYLLIVLLSLAILALVAISPEGFLNTGSIYRGF